MVLILFFLSLCLLYLQIGNNELNGQAKSTISNTEKGVVNSKEPSAAQDVPAKTMPVDFTPVLNSTQSFQTHSDQTQLWLISHPDGVRIETSYVPKSEFVSHLPWGTVVTGNILQSSKSADQPDTTHHRLFISFPVVGWLTLSHRTPSHDASSRMTFFLRPLNTTYTPVVQIADAGAAGCSDTASHLQHTDFKGGDLVVAQLSGQSNPVKVSSNAQCCTVCCNTPNCVYWTRTEGGDCWLKGLNAVQTPTDKVLTSGVRLKQCNIRIPEPVSTVYYTSSTVCVDNTAGSDSQTSGISDLTHHLYSPVYDTPCADSTNSKCGISSYRATDSSEAGVVPSVVHILQRERGLPGIF